MNKLKLNESKTKIMNNSITFKGQFLTASLNSRLSPVNLRFQFLSSLNLVFNLAVKPLILNLIRHNISGLNSRLTIESS